MQTSLNVMKLIIIIGYDNNKDVHVASQWCYSTPIKVFTLTMIRKK